MSEIIASEHAAKQYNKASVAEVRKREEEKKTQLIGTLKPHRGHTLYKVHKITLEISEAEFASIDYEVGKSKPNRKVIVDKNYWYISALNKKNVQKKLDKFLGK